MCVEMFLVFANVLAQDDETVDVFKPTAPTKVAVFRGGRKARRIERATEA